MYTGVWDVMSNVEVAEFIRKKIASNMKPPLVRKALSLTVMGHIEANDAVNVVWY